MKTESGKQVIVLKVLLDYMETVNTPLLKSEIIAAIKAQNPELDESKILTALDHARSRKGAIIGDGKIPSRYLIKHKALKKEAVKREKGEILRRFVAGVRDPLTPRDYDLKAGMNLAMLIRR